MGSLSYCARENLSNLAGFIIRVISYYIKDFWGLERDFLAEFEYLKLLSSEILRSKMSVLSGRFWAEIA